MSNYTRFGMFLVALLAAGLGWRLAGWEPSVATDQEQLRLNAAAAPPQGDAALEQTFVAGHAGLSAVELLAAVYPVTSSAELNVQLLDAAQTVVAGRVFSDVTHNAALRLEFAPQPDSAGKTYTIRVAGSASNQRLAVWTYTLDGYARGALRVAGQPAAGDLRFSTAYTYLWPEMAQDALAGLARLGLRALPLWLILFVPGWLMLEGVWPAARWPISVWVRWGLALALSLSVLPLAWLWLTVVGGRWSVVPLAGAYGLLGLCAVGRLGTGLLRGEVRLGRFTWTDFGLAGIILVSLVVHLLAARDVALPMWVDSPHHHIIAQVCSALGQVPQTYQPILPVERFTYHFGFHVLAVAAQWLTAAPLVDIFIWVGQGLQGLAPLAAAAGVELLTGRRRAAVGAAFLVGLVSFFPGYYLSWGRYTQLMGLLILMPLLGLTGQLTRGRRLELLTVGPAWINIGLVGALAAGLALTHYRVLGFFAIFAVVAAAAGARGGWKRLAVAALVGGLLALPWLWRLGLYEVAPIVAQPVVAAQQPGYNNFPWDYFKGALERGWLLVALGVIGMGLICRSRPMGLMAGWLAVTFALLNIGPGTWIINNNSWAISLFVPGAFALGWGFDRYGAVCGRLLRSSLKGLPLLGLGLGAGLAGVLVYAGVKGCRTQVGVINPVTILAKADDRQALDWVAQHTPPDAVFLVNSWEWANGIWSGTDGGVWLWPYTGRRSTMPPLDYFYQPDWFAQLNDFNQRAMQVTDWNTAAAQALLREQGVTHIYIGARGGPLKPELFVNSAQYRQAYTNGAVWVFEVAGE